jgi:hypothetical protein
LPGAKRRLCGSNLRRGISSRSGQSRPRFRRHRPQHPSCTADRREPPHVLSPTVPRPRRRRLRRDGPLARLRLGLPARRHRQRNRLPLRRLRLHARVRTGRDAVLRTGRDAVLNRGTLAPVRRPQLSPASGRGLALATACRSGQSQRQRGGFGLPRQNDADVIPRGTPGARQSSSILRAARIEDVSLVV